MVAYEFLLCISVVTIKVFVFWISLVFWVSFELSVCARFEPSMELVLRNHQVDILYFDNTYSHPSCEFPVRVGDIAQSEGELECCHPSSLFLFLFVVTCRRNWLRKLSRRFSLTRSKEPCLLWPVLARRVCWFRLPGPPNIVYVLLAMTRIEWTCSWCFKEAHYILSMYEGICAGEVIINVA